ncbi:xylan 1,4-beta-xylosidase [Plantactinospora siamensis]|uniref:Xylan 1,4-beta-xylosidase n=1 Tax=Plantactinospora siamensis TaxID=555372 RepID=A0ABV6NRV3_9ACTN
MPDPIEVPAEPVGRLPGAWRHCVGTGRFDLALRRDYQESLALVQREIGFRHIRGHGILSDGVGVYRPYEYDGARRVRHAFTYLDQVLDAYLELGIRPFVELGFMPADLAAGDQTVFWWRGNVTPPRSEREWTDLVRGTVAHLIDRYGVAEVRRWPIEVWNEPDLDIFWAGADRAAYHRLYELTATAVKEVDAELQVGGPAVSPGGPEWLVPFAEFVADRSVPVDFVSRHAYSSGPAREVPFGTRQTLAPASHLLEQFAQPRRALAGTALAGLPVHITEFNSSYRPDNPVHDTAFHAAYLAPVLAAGGDLVDSFSYWTLCDVFEEVGIPTTLLHGGFGLLTHRQLKKPTYHLYAFLARLGDQVLARGPDHLVTRDDTGRIAVLAWAPVDVTGRNPAPDRHTVALSLPLGGAAPAGSGAGAVGPAGSGAGAAGAAGSAFLLRSTVSEEWGNLWAAWTELGCPASPTERQLDALRAAAEPARRHARLAAEAGRVTLELHLSRHEVTLAEVTPVVDETPSWFGDGLPVVPHSAGDKGPG